MRERNKNRMHRLCLAILACLIAIASTDRAMAQMTDAHKAAIKSSCRSDYMSNCMSVSPGGIEALQCLQKHMTRLSPSCQTAVKAATAKPAAATPPPPAPPPPKKAAAPSAAPPAVVASPPPARAAAPQPAKKKVNTTAPKPAVKHVTKPAAKPAAAPPQQAAVAPPMSLTPPPPPETHMPNAPIVMTAVIGRACLRDLVRHCRDIKIGDGRKIACLTEHADRLTVLCKAAMKITAPVR